MAQLGTEALQINGLKKVRKGKENSSKELDLKDDWCLGIFQEFHRLQDENIQLKNICEDQEQALEELGSKLSEYVYYHFCTNSQFKQVLVVYLKATLFTSSCCFCFQSVEYHNFRKTRNGKRAFSMLFWYTKIVRKNVN